MHLARLKLSTVLLLLILVLNSKHRSADDIEKRGHILVCFRLREFLYDSM